MNTRKCFLSTILLGIFLISTMLNVNTIRADQKELIIDPPIVITGSALDADDNIILTSITGNGRLLITKYDTDGSLIWKEELINDQKIIGSVMIILPDSRILILREDENSVFLSIYSSSGQLQYDGQIDSTFLRFPRFGSGPEGRKISEFVELDSQRNLIVLLAGSSVYNLYKISILPTSLGVSLWKRELKGITTDYINRFQAKASIGIDTNDNIIIQGWTSNDLSQYITPNAHESVRSGIQNSFLLKLSPGNNLIWGTYYSNNPTVQGDVLIDENDNIIMIGRFTAFFDFTGNLLWEQEFGVGEFSNRFLGRDNSIVLISEIQSGLNTMGVESFDADLMDRTGGNQDAMIKYDMSREIIFNTFLGSRSMIDNTFSGSVTTLNELSNGNIVITGWIRETDIAQSNRLQTTPNAFQEQLGGSQDAFLTILNSDGSPVTSTYVGGDKLEVFQSLKEDQLENLVLLGTTGSTNFPSIDSYALNGGTDNLLLKFDKSGQLLWIKNFGGDGSEVSNKHSLLISQTNQIIVVGITSSQELDENIGESISFLGTRGYLASISEEGELEWTLGIGDNKVEEPDEINPKILAITIFAIVILSGLTYLIKILYFNKQIKVPNFPGNIGKIISPLLGEKPELLYLFTGTTLLGDDNRGKQTTNEIPSAIFDFKEFLHPIRLAIIKLLYENTRMESTEVVKLIGIGKKDVYNHIRTLKNNGFLHSETNFVDGNMKTVIQLEPATVKKFQELSTLLVNFLTLAPNMDQYLHQAIEIREKSKDNLYPDNN